MLTNVVLSVDLCQGFCIPSQFVLYDKGFNRYPTCIERDHFNKI